MEDTWSRVDQHRQARRPVDGAVAMRNRLWHLPFQGTRGGMTITVAQGVLHGPVWMRVLAICLWFGESAPFVAHLFSSLCLGLIGLSMASLAGRFGAPRLSTGLLVALSPVPLVLAGNIMTDLPMLALFCASLAAAARGFAKALDVRVHVAGLVDAVEVTHERRDESLWPEKLRELVLIAAERTVGQRVLVLVFPDVVGNLRV